MIYGLLTFVYTLACLLLILIILIQKGKSSMGIGGMGGGAQMLFGGGGGQDLLQKITWGLGAVFIGGSLLLSIMKTSQPSKYLEQYKGVPTMPVQKQVPEKAPKQNQE
jgi:preprotein translocase subunit SecG